MKTTDDELKQLLAKMLPEDVFFTADGVDFNWSNASENCPKERRGYNVLDTELLHLCSLVEAGLTWTDEQLYTKELNKLYGQGIRPAFATWQQRTSECAKVLGVTL